MTSPRPHYKTCPKCGRQFWFPGEWNKHLNDRVEYPVTELQRTTIKKNYLASVQNGTYRAPNQGKHLSEETKRRLSEAVKRGYANGRIPWRKGKRFVFHSKKELREMRREYEQTYRKRHPEKAKAHFARWKQKHPNYNRDWHARNKDYYNTRKQDWRQKNKPHCHELEKKQREAHPEKVRERWFRSEHGISSVQFERMKNVQDNRCGICQSLIDSNSEPHDNIHPQVDHSHATNQIRGILCRPCNTALGYFKDNTNSLQRAISYLSGSLQTHICITDAETASAISEYMTPAKLKVRRQLFAEQGGLCAICQRQLDERKPHGLHVDHDHSTNKVRGLLCGPCNWGLGMFKDSIPIIEAAKRYLEAGGVPQILPILAPIAKTASESKLF
jgi:hypothetical protein